MSDDFKGLLGQALEQAVQERFCHLFSVLFTEPDEAAYKRFHAGISRLADMERTVGVYIAELP
jgi:hypothetical protein